MNTMDVMLIEESPHHGGLTSSTYNHDTNHYANNYNQIWL